jgi:DNA mismatch repair protein MutL
MTDIIRLLPVAVANQIAAGEVVQRPASAVKELLENAIDAGASDITLIVKDAGKALIQVVDNGKGMSPNDARVAFERHATSKISTADDLFNLSTKGFRGEALASVAAIAQVEMLTRQQGQPLGTRVVIEGSDIKLQETEACTEGTSIAVRNLFFNVPARRNFLKSNAVEMKHMLDEFHRVALAHPDIRFQMVSNDTETYVLPISPLKQRIINVFGKSYNERLIPVEESTDVVTIRGYITKPEFAKKTRGEQYFFVNGRFIRSNYLNHAIQTAYNELVSKEEFPSWFVFLDLDPAKIDINIHPTKTEVKFEDERPIYAILHSAVRSSLGRFNIRPSLDFDLDPQFNQSFSQKREIKPPQITINPNYNPFAEETHRPGRQQKMEQFMAWGETLKTASVDFQALTEQLGTAAPEIQQVIRHEDEPAVALPTFFQLDRRFVVSHIRSGIIVVHQQRAHQRILFEKFLDTGFDAASQQLMFPLQVMLQKNEATLMHELLDELRACGFGVEIESGMLSFDAVPAVLEEFNAEAFCQSVLDDALHQAPGPDAGLRRKLARSLAVSQSIRSGKPLTDMEMNNLVDELFACSEPAYSPSGLRVFVTFGLDDLESRFK